MARRVATIPAVVLARLSDEARSEVLEERATPEGAVPVEVRTSKLESRSNDDGTLSLSGYATVYDHTYPVAGGPENGGWNETIARGASAKGIQRGDDVRLLFDHGGIPLARTRSKTLTLASDNNGLRYTAPNLDANSPYAQSVVSAIRRGDVDQSSFAFRVTAQTWNDDYTDRVISDYEMFDVSPVTYPASEATVVQMNSRRAGESADTETEEDAIVAQIEALVARLIQIEAGELAAGGEACGALSALVSVLSSLDWYETVDDMEDAMPAEGMAMTSHIPLGLARAQADALRLCSA